MLDELATIVARCYRDGEGSARVDGWAVEEVARGSNGIVFRVRSGEEDLAAKVSQLDERDRAGRELAAFELLARRGVAVAPEPKGVVRSPDGVPVAVLFAGWRSGSPVERPPEPDAPLWRPILEAYAAVHRVELDGAALRPAMLGVDVHQVVADMRSRARLNGDTASEPLIDAAESSVESTLPANQARRLVHCDANLANVLLDGERTTIVDWENSGWGDPCFDVANVVMTPQLADRSLADWEPLFAAHAELLGDGSLADRTRAHARLMAAWWVVRLRQELAAPTPRLPGVARFGDASTRDRLARCEDRARDLFG